eukprot:1056192_1
MASQRDHDELECSSCGKEFNRITHFTRSQLKKWNPRCRVCVRISLDQPNVPKSRAKTIGSATIHVTDEDVPHDRATVCVVTHPLAPGDTITISTQCTLSQLKTKLCKFPNKHFRVFYGNRELHNDSATLKQYNVSMPTHIHLTIKTPNSLFMLLEKKETKIQSIRHHISERNISTKRMQLMYNDTVLETKYSLQDYSIPNHSILYLTERTFEDEQRGLERDILQNAHDTYAQTQAQMQQFKNKILSDAKRQIESCQSIAGFHKVEVSPIFVQIQDFQAFHDAKELGNQIDKQKKQIDSLYQMEMEKRNRKIDNHSDQIRILQHEITELEKRLGTLVAKQMHHKQEKNELVTECEALATSQAVRMKEVDTKIAEFRFNCEKQLKEMDAKFRELYDSKVGYFEKNYDLWNTDDVVAWMRIVENGYFNDLKFRKLFDVLHKTGVDGKQIKQINILFLKAAELTHADAAKLYGNIARLGKKKGDVLCGICIANQIDTVMIPCYHQYFCNGCVSKRKIERCPICRAMVKEIKQTFMAGF